MTRTRLLLSLLAALALSSCSSRPRNFFPLGLFAVHTPDEIALAKAEGFNAFQAYPNEPEKLEPLAIAAKKAGLKMLAHPHGMLAAGKAAPRWPMAAWYLQDEPDVVKMDPAYLAGLRAKVKAWDPGTPSTFVVGNGKAASRFSEGGDILMVDWYPVPHLKLESVADHVRWTMEAAKGRPVWAVLQAFDWRWSKQHQPDDKRIGRFPSSAEIRYMSYLALIEGARGLWYFALEPGDGIILSERTELWIRLTRVSRELSQFLPVLEEGSDLGPIPDLPEEMRGRSWRKGGRTYYALAGTSEFMAILPERFRMMRPLFERHRDIADLLPDFGLPYGRVLVLEDN